jgi:hypothetical protein
MTACNGTAHVYECSDTGTLQRQCGPTGQWDKFISTASCRNSELGGLNPEEIGKREKK